MIDRQTCILDSKHNDVREAIKTSFSELFPNTSDTPISEAVSEHLDREYW